MALGSLGWTEEVFYSTTPRAFTSALVSWSKDEQRRDRAEWERARWVATITLAPHSKRRLKPTDLFRFDDEIERVPAKVKQLDPAHEQRLIEKFNAWGNDKGTA